MALLLSCFCPVQNIPENLPEVYFKVVWVVVIVSNIEKSMRVLESGKRVLESQQISNFLILVS